MDFLGEIIHAQTKCGVGEGEPINRMVLLFDDCNHASKESMYRLFAPTLWYPFHSFPNIVHWEAHTQGKWEVPLEENLYIDSILATCPIATNGR